MKKIAETAVIHPDVELGDHAVVEDFCVIGAPTRDGKRHRTIIGDHAMIRAGTVIYAGNTIGSHFQTGNQANIRELNTIGNQVSIGTLSVIEHHVVIEDGVRIHSQVFVPEHSVLKKGAWIGPQAVLTNARYPNEPDTKSKLEGPVIEEGAKVGANATILPGVKIGAGSLVGAGAVITKNVPAKSVWAGNPARQIERGKGRAK